MAKRLAILFAVKLVFLRVLLLLILLVFWLGNDGMQSRAILFRVGFQKLRHVEDVIWRKLLDEIASRQIDPVMLFHPLLEIRRNVKLRDELIEIDDAFRILHFLAYIGKAPRQEVESHSAHRFRLPLRWPDIGGELDTAGRAGRAGLCGRRSNSQS